MQSSLVVAQQRIAPAAAFLDTARASGLMRDEILGVSLANFLIAEFSTPLAAGTSRPSPTSRVAAPSYFLASISAAVGASGSTRTSGFWRACSLSSKLMQSPRTHEHSPPDLVDVRSFSGLGTSERSCIGLPWRQHSSEVNSRASSLSEVTGGSWHQKAAPSRELSWNCEVG